MIKKINKKSELNWIKIFVLVLISIFIILIGWKFVSLLISLLLAINFLLINILIILNVKYKNPILIGASVGAFLGFIYCWFPEIFCIRWLGCICEIFHPVSNFIQMLTYSLLGVLVGYLIARIYGKRKK